jgi:hypothetical protein
VNPPFRLYPEERHWWSFADYGAVLDVMQRLKPKRVLEFGPGSSTLALIEGGATRIDTCEDDRDWQSVYEERLQAVYPDIVTVVPYTWSDPIQVPALSRRRYDLALIDGPYTSEKRPAVIEYALNRSAAVLVPTEDDGRAQSGFLRPVIAHLAEKYQRTVEFMETGPLSGGFALLTRKEDD